MTAKVKFKLRIVRPLESLAKAEKRATVGRDFSAEPWLRGEGPKFFTPARVARMARDNEALRKARRK